MHEVGAVIELEHAMNQEIELSVDLQVPEGCYARVLHILHDSVVDGDGLRTVIFFSGCPHRCRGCHNPESWNLNHGSLVSVRDLVAEVLANPLSDVTLSGGDPFLQAAVVKVIARALSHAGKHIWAYTGYTLEQILENGTADQLELLSWCNVLVDGRFEQQLRTTELPYRGSSNQVIWKRKAISGSPLKELWEVHELNHSPFMASSE